MRLKMCVTVIGEFRNAYGNFLRNSEGKRTLGIPRHKRKDILGIDIRRTE
jgi:hypothetical protein